MAQKVGWREKLAQKVGRREIYCPVPPPSEMARLEVLLFSFSIVNFAPIISKYAPTRPKR